MLLGLQSLYEPSLSRFFLLQTLCERSLRRFFLLQTLCEPCLKKTRFSTADNVRAISIRVRNAFIFRSCKQFKSILFHLLPSGVISPQNRRCSGERAAQYTPCWRHGGREGGNAPAEVRCHWHRATCGPSAPCVIVACRATYKTCPVPGIVFPVLSGV